LRLSQFIGGGSQIVLGADYDLFRIGRGPAGTPTGSNVGFQGNATQANTPEFFEISGLTIQAAKGFYGSTQIIFNVHNALSVDIHHFALYDFGFEYGPTNGAVFALIPSGPNAGWPYAKLPQPGVTTDPRGAGYQSADMGYLGVPAKYQGAFNYKNFIRNGQVNGCNGALEIGLYNDNNNIPQGCVYKDLIVARSHTMGCIQFSGDGSNAWDGIYSFQNKEQGFVDLPPAGAPAGVGYSVNWNKCGADGNGYHGFHLWDQLSGGQTVGVGMTDCYAAASGTPEQVASSFPTRRQANGILLQNGICSSVSMNRCAVVVNGGDGAEICATVGPAVVRDSRFSNNGQFQNNSSVTGNGRTAADRRGSGTQSACASSDRDPDRCRALGSPSS
jgi:hypothetical protein